MKKSSTAPRTAHPRGIAAHSVLADPLDQGVVLGNRAHRCVRDARPRSEHQDGGRCNRDRSDPAPVVERDGLLVLINATVLQIHEAQGVLEPRQLVQVVRDGLPS